MTVSWSRVRDVGRKHVAGILAGVAVVGLVQFGLLETLEHWSLDRLFEWRGPRTPHLSVVIVTLDEPSFAELNEQWPFPRAMHGQLLTKIAAGKPRATARAGVRVDAVPDAGDVLINLRGGLRTYPWVSYYRVLRDEIPSEFWKDKIVLVGTTTEILHDQFATAFAGGGDMPGVEIHANALETLVRGNAIREVPQPLSTVLAVMAGLFGAALVVRLRAFRALLAATGFWAILTLAAFGGFVLGDVWMRGMAGTVALVLGYGATVIENFVREQRERRQLSQFFSPSVVREVVRHKEEGSLTTSRRLVTVLFSDIRGFTSLSEKLQPEQVAEMLREYLTEMTEIVFRHGGTIDKYIGDCVMALYNVPFEDPEHAIKAVRTGLEFQERTLIVSKRWEEKLGIAIRNGVGINTGEAVVGTLGSKQRLEYTAIGDTINLGARLESITKDYKANITISESTYVLVKDQFVTKELGDVTVKGKSQPVKIYAVLPTSLDPEWAPTVAEYLSTRAK